MSDTSDTSDKLQGKKPIGRPMIVGNVNTDPSSFEQGDLVKKQSCEAWVFFCTMLFKTSFSVDLKPLQDDLCCFNTAIFASFIALLATFPFFLGSLILRYAVIYFVSKILVETLNQLTAFLYRVIDEFRWLFQFRSLIHCVSLICYYLAKLIAPALFDIYHHPFRFGAVTTVGITLVVHEQWEVMTYFEYAYSCYQILVLQYNEFKAADATIFNILSLYKHLVDDAFDVDATMNQFYHTPVIYYPTFTDVQQQISSGDEGSDHPSDLDDPEPEPRPLPADAPPADAAPVAQIIVDSSDQETD